MKASQRELLCLKDLLESYGQSTRLRNNYAFNISYFRNPN
jgi:hypothetical protein